MLKSKHNSMFLFECYAVTMLGNIFLHPLLLLCPNMRSSISHLVLILLNKMRLLNVKTDILLRQLVPSFSIVMFLFVFGGMLFLQPVTWLIVCPHLYYWPNPSFPPFSYPTSLFPSSSCLWLYLFCSYSHTWTGQALRQGYEMHLLRIFSTSEGLLLLFP